MNIPQSDVDEILTVIKDHMSRAGIDKCIIDRTVIEIVHPENWEVSLFVPYQKGKSTAHRKAIEKILFTQCGVEQNCCDFLGKENPHNSYEWYFRHPKVPKDIYERLEMDIERILGEENGMGLPVPSGTKSKSDTAFITIQEEFFREIEQGRKKREDRNLNQYYCDKFFSPGVKKKYLKINRGYNSGAGNQMIFEIKEINLVSEDGRETPAIDEDGELITSFSKLPSRFAPAAYGIVLGKRIA